jgi:hypothetical protein
VRDRDAQAATEGISGVFLGLRDLSRRGSERGSADRLSQGVKDTLRGSVCFQKVPDSNRRQLSKDFSLRKTFFDGKKIFGIAE